MTRDERILSCLPLVEKLATRFVPQSDSLHDDLVSAGTIGMIGAVDSFDENGGTRLTTWCWYRIRGEMLDLLEKEDRLQTNVSELILNPIDDNTPDPLSVAHATAIFDELMADFSETQRKLVWQVLACGEPIPSAARRVGLAPYDGHRLVRFIRQSIEQKIL